ncbi:MAG: hypothetical protein QOJ65_1092 [Fimbriimonadaceae bacterium]|jgi:phosphatidylglycerol lysyltransferase|nr:hypothetical protein [Fimbriimonadaceae bacterium]
MRHGWNTTCYQVLNPGIERWFSQRGDAIVGYVTAKGRRVVAGAPICSRERLDEVLVEWEKAAPLRPCYFGAEERLYSALREDPAYSKVVLGAQPVWTTESWIVQIQGNASLRYQIQRALHKDVRVSEWPAERVRNNSNLRAVLGEWLHTRGLPPMHFLVEPETLDWLGDRRLFVAEQRGQAVGFVTMSPVPMRKGWLTEQFVRGQGAPNGTIELMLDTAIRAVAAQGGQMVTMGIVPLSQRASVDGVQNPGWLRGVTAWMRAHGRRFYNFDGLDTFKSKFHPDYWEPIYVISREAQFSPRTLYAIASAFTSGHPMVAVVKGLGRAVRQEAAWLGHSRHSHS